MKRFEMSEPAKKQRMFNRRAARRPTRLGTEGFELIDKDK